MNILVLYIVSIVINVVAFIWAKRHCINRNTTLEDAWNIYVDTDYKFSIKALGIWTFIPVVNVVLTGLILSSAIVGVIKEYSK